MMTAFLDTYVCLSHWTPSEKRTTHHCPRNPYSTDELAEIDYSLLGAVSVVDVKDQDCQFHAELFGLNERTPACSSDGNRLPIRPANLTTFVKELWIQR